MTTRCLIGVFGFAGSARAGGREDPVSHTAMSRALHAGDTGGGYTTPAGEGEVRRPHARDRWNSPAAGPLPTLQVRYVSSGMRTDPMERSQRPCPVVPSSPVAIS